MTQDDIAGKMIMIVDDDQALGEMLSIVLENEGFRTTTCLDGLRAVEMFPTVVPDLILLDVMLPGIDGTEVARRIRETSSNVPIIMLTAKSDTVDVVAGLEAGADDYVPKPFKVAELIARIRARFRIRAKLAAASAAAPTRRAPARTRSTSNAARSSSTAPGTPLPRTASTWRSPPWSSSCSPCSPPVRARPSAAPRCSRRCGGMTATATRVS
nr:response regulator [Bifidobacterium stellenboschense]